MGEVRCKVTLLTLCSKPHSRTLSLFNLNLSVRPLASPKQSDTPLQFPVPPVPLW